MSQYKFSILLSASIPKEKRSKKYLKTYRKIKNAQIQIEEAVICLTRNIFQAGGRIVFGGHPSISPLVAMVASEFDSPRVAENQLQSASFHKPITIYQSEAFLSVIPRETTNLNILGYADIKWIKSKNNEQYDPKLENVAQCTESLTAMREAMIDQPLNALVCVGGMEGVEEEFDIFRRIHKDKKVYLLASTGGAAGKLADTNLIKTEMNNLIEVSDDINYSLDIPNADKEMREQFELIPFSYITARIVREVLNRSRG